METPECLWTVSFWSCPEATLAAKRLKLGVGRSGMPHVLPVGPFSRIELTETVFDALDALFAPGKHLYYKNEQK